MKFSMLAIVGATSMGAASAQMMLKSDWMTAMWCCADSGFRCEDACRVANDCQLQWEACRAQPKSVAELDAECGTEASSPCLFFGLGQGIVIAPGPEQALNPGQDMFGATTYGEVPAACRANTVWRCCDGGDGFVCGDPHFQTWGGLDYDYQGACDLKFLSAPNYAKGLGLDVHIRTDTRFDYSFISAAAVKIGDSILEVGAWGEYIVNGVDGAKGNGHVIKMDRDIPVTYEKKGDYTHIYRIDASKLTGDADSIIRIQTYKDWVSIHFEYPHEADFGDSVGMLGSFPEGKRFARDGVTIMEDDNAFGQEWQVLPEEAFLFEGARSPQHPEKCVMPSGVPAHTEVKVTEAEAVAACAHLENHNEFCVRDVMATQDLDMATASAAVF